MFDDLRDAFREAVRNFKDELGRDEVPATVDRLFLEMTREVRAARELVAGLERQIEEARAQATKDADEEASCRRRGDMAARVGDQETARIALEFAARHERRRVVLEKKLVALDEERQIRVVELEEMTLQLGDAQAKRDDLTAAAGSDDAGDAIRAADELFAELDRMAGETGSRGGSASRTERAGALDDLEREFRELRVDPWAPVPRKEIDPDAALEELKRRMRESGG